MIAAHMDEIGLIATHITEDGFVRVSNLGGVHGAYAVGQRVRFLNGTLGVIGHEFEGFTGNKISLDKLFVDVGATSMKDCPVQIGDAAVFEGRFQEIAGRWTGKALDDRISVAVLIETLRILGKSPHELWFVFTAMEEGGRKGAGPAAFAIDPDIGIALDVLTAGDTPKGYASPVELGKGPALKMMDARLIADPVLMHAVEHGCKKDWAVDAARRAQTRRNRRKHDPDHPRGDVPRQTWVSLPAISTVRWSWWMPAMWRRRYPCCCNYWRIRFNCEKETRCILCSDAGSAGDTITDPVWLCRGEPDCGRIWRIADICRKDCCAGGGGCTDSGWYQRG